MNEREEFPMISVTLIISKNPDMPHMISLSCGTGKCLQKEMETLLDRNLEEENLLHF